MRFEIVRDPAETERPTLVITRKAWTLYLWWRRGPQYYFDREDV